MQNQNISAKTKTKNGQNLHMSEGKLDR